MLDCLPECQREEASRTWARLLASFGKEEKAEILLSRLMRTVPELSNEFEMPWRQSSCLQPGEPRDPPAKGVFLKEIAGVKVMQATPSWWLNPSDGGVYVGSGTNFCARSNFWADGKTKATREAGREALCGRPLYVKDAEEIWNAEEVIELFHLHDTAGVAFPVTQSEGLTELRRLARAPLSVCSLGLVLKYLVLARPSQLGCFARVLPCAALRTLQGESVGLLPMRLPETSLKEVAAVEKLLKLKPAENLADTKYEQLRKEISELGANAWSWLLILSLNWQYRGMRTEEVLVPGYPIAWTSAQEAVAQRIFRCVAHFCAEDRLVTVRPWKESSVSRGPGHCGLPLHGAFPLDWASIKETFWGTSGGHPSKRRKFSKCFKKPEEWSRASVELVHRTGVASVEVMGGPKVLVRSESEWVELVQELAARQVLEVTDEEISPGTPLCGAYGIHRGWSAVGDSDPRRLLSLVFDVDLVNFLYKDLEEDSDLVRRSYARGGRLVMHPDGIKVAFPQVHGDGVEIFWLDEPWRKDFVLNKAVPAEAFGFSGRPRFPRLLVMPRGWHNGMLMTHRPPKKAPAYKITEGWPLSVQDLDAGSGWLQHGRNEDGVLKLWLDSGDATTTLEFEEGETNKVDQSISKLWFLRIFEGELRFEARVLHELIGAVVHLLMNEGVTTTPTKEIAGVASLMVHLNRCSLAGASVVQPVIDSMSLERGHVQVSLHWGDQVWAALLGSLAHGLPLKLLAQDPVAVDASEGTGGAAVAEFGGAGSLTEALKLLGISPIGIVFIENDEKLRRHFKQRHPDAIVLPAIEKVARKDVITWRKFFSKASIVLHGGGWPCQDQSRLNADRKGADSARGKLLEPMLVISKWLKEVANLQGCHPWQVIEFYENVMFDDRDEGLFFQKIGWNPFHVKGEEFMHCRRPRQFWIQGLEVPLGNDLVLEPSTAGPVEKRHTKVVCKASPPPLKFFLESGAERLQPDAGPWPTFTRPVKKASPPAVVAGIKTASDAAKRRWKGDAYRLSVYQYEDAWLVRDASGVRRLKAIEAARMMGLNSWHFKLGRLKFTEDEMGQAVGNMFSPLVAARLLCGLLPEACRCSLNLTEQLWQSWLKNELVEENVLSEYTSGLPWLPPRLLACSLRSQLGGSAVACGGQVQSWMMEQGSVRLATKLCIWDAQRSPSLLNLSKGNSGLGVMAGSCDVSAMQWKNLVQYKPAPGSEWNTTVNAAEAALRRILRSSDAHCSMRLVASQDLGTAYLLCSTTGGPCYAFGRLAALVLASRAQIHVAWASHPLSLARARARQNVGSLQSQVVQPKTLKRYERAVHAFLDFLIAHELSYPRSNALLDSFVCGYIEELWENGDPKGWAGDLLSGLGHLIPSCKGSLTGGWRLHAAWGRAELPVRALPFTPKIVYALAQQAFDRQWKDTGVLLLLGFHRYPRSGELFQARKADFTFDRLHSPYYNRFVQIEDAEIRGSGNRNTYQLSELSEKLVLTPAGGNTVAIFNPTYGRYLQLDAVGTGCVSYGHRVVIAQSSDGGKNQCGWYGCRVGNMVNNKMYFGHGGATPYGFYIRAPPGSGKSGCISYGDTVVIAYTSDGGNTGCGWYGCRVAAMWGDNSMGFGHGTANPHIFYIRWLVWLPSGFNDQQCNDFWPWRCKPTAILLKTNQTDINKPPFVGLCKVCHCGCLSPHANAGRSSCGLSQRCVQPLSQIARNCSSEPNQRCG
eukprot:s2887_g2.t1